MKRLQQGWASVRDALDAIGWAPPALAMAAQADEAPLRSELYTADQMAQHGKSLAATHELTSTRSADQLLPRLDSNEKVLVEVWSLLMRNAERQLRVSPAGEWLLDNFYLVEEEIRTTKLHLPPGYSRELPRLSSGPSTGLPRVYDLALHAVAHSDARMGRGALSHFVVAYQTVKTLQLGELWAFPIMLRLALIENLRRVAVRVAMGRNERNLANTWAEKMLDVTEKEPKGLILVIADMARSDPPMTSAFVAELVRRLQGRSVALALPLTWIEQRLAESNQTIEQLVQAEAQSQAAAQVSVSNSIGSLRTLAAMDWREFVETHSLVEKTLRDDPAGVYGYMDFKTRDSYRHAVERLAKRSALSEQEVAAVAIRLATAAARAPPQGSQPSPAAAAPKDHVGYYLVDTGQQALEREAQVRGTPWWRLQQLAKRGPLKLYSGSIVLLTFLLSYMAVLAAATVSHSPVTDWPLGGWLLIPAAALLLATSQLAVSLVNWAASLVATPNMLPRMDYAHGIAPSAKTLVVVPSMLTSAASIDHLVEQLEVRFLANRDAQLHFALLTDYADAPHPTRSDDQVLLALAVEKIEALNHKHQTPSDTEQGSDRFYLLHRPRRWNAREGVWMGHERKRGKLADLNALLRGRASAGPDERFATIVGKPQALQSVRYVITLDTDTHLPRDAAWQLVATMAHPLNHPHVAPVAGGLRVVRGHGILQPRVADTLLGSSRSRYARLFGGELGIDPYTRTVSDVYQDLFAEGSFIGKGIYDVDAVEAVLDGRLPDNRILSHDLLEGCYARSGLVSDVQVFEDSPSRFDADMKRRHRWIRGDWQIMAWAMPSVRAPKAQAASDVKAHVAPDAKAEPAFGLQRNPLSTLSRLKIADNLRRSLAPAALSLLLLLGWFALEAPWVWSVVALGILVLPPLAAGLASLLRKPRTMRLGQHLSTVASGVDRQLAQAALTLACLPYEACVNMDAVLRTLVRLFITRRHLLQWQPSAELEPISRPGGMSDLLQSYLRMIVGPVVAIAGGMGLAAWRPAALAAAAPILLLWFLSPLLVWWLSRPSQRQQPVLDAAQTRSLRLLSRRTWAFFETYVGAEDNHLPPDNVQDHPVARVAHRTSPTNIGLSLLSALSAYDFGYLTLRQLIERTEATFNTMGRLTKHHGHFLNWYDTLTLEPLRPCYVSTVDSGNLAGHLLTLGAGLRLLADQEPQPLQLLDGMLDSFRLLQLSSPKPASSAAQQRFAMLLKHARHAAPTDAASSAAKPTAITLTANQALQVTFDDLAQSAQALVDEALAQPRGTAAPEAEAEAARQTLAEAQRWAFALKHQCDEACAELRALSPPDSSPPAHASVLAWNSAALAQRRTRLLALAEQASAMARMDYGFLFDATRKLLTIGYNVDEHRRDAGHYDLLASEVRLATFTAVAQGQVPQESWFALSRLLTSANGDAVLLSWSGSMFEYLMPMLVMPSYPDTLLDQTMHAAVRRQINYGRLHNVPWGISESGYHVTDAQLNYQYRAFGVPGLGLKRGLADDMVVAPYATVMSLMVEPQAACANLERLAQEGLASPFGYFEAIDYTPSRLPRGQTRAIVRSHMVHHQGMSLLALAYVLLDQPMQRRFTADPELQATLLLLQERIPKVVAFHPHTADRADLRSGSATAETQQRLITNVDTAAPEVQLLSNGRYHVMLTNAGGGVSRWQDLAVTRWREDTTCDGWGSFCYLRDTGTGAFWSSTHQPTVRKAQAQEAIFSEGRAEFRRRDNGIDAYTEVVVSPEDDIELRRLRLTNLGPTRRTIEVTSYAEVVIAPAAADVQHPAFSKLFVQTEALSEPAALLCTRRPRSANEHPPHMFHLMAVHGAKASAATHETDRARFIGRGRTLRSPQAMRAAASTLSGTTGSVLDAVVATRRVITLEPEQTATIDLVYGMAETRDACVALIHKYVDRRLADRVFELAWTHNQVILRQINASETDTQLYARLAGAIHYSQPTLRAEASVLLRNRRSQSGLWGYAISGDLPIVLLQVSDAENIDLVKQMVQAHAWWRLKGLAVDLVIWNEERDVYRQRLQELILGFIAAGLEAHVVDRPGGIFVRHAEQISAEDRVLLQSVARAVITDRHGTLAEQVNRKVIAERRVPPLVPMRAAEPAEPNPTLPAFETLSFDNSTGGFSADGREYVITPAPGRPPPAPWVNVIANPRFGTVVSESGSAYTWCENAHELRLTPWHNDPVTDIGGEAIYLRDEASGDVWHPTAQLRPDGEGATSLSGEAGALASAHRTRHGFGYSVFEHLAHGIHSELTVFVAMDMAVKFSVLKLSNRSGRTRQLSATGYVEWVLGDVRAKTAPHISTDLSATTGALFARNPYSNDFGDWVAFFDVDPSDRASASITGDRDEFIGRNGSMQQPAALQRLRLSGHIGAGLDPCAAIQVPFELAAGHTREISFRLGMGRSVDEADTLVKQCRGSSAGKQALDAVHRHWQHTLSAVQVTTPDAALNLLANGWLVYQTLSCRMWARSGFYQSGGAYGFRDQLQDAMALVHTRPDLLREHLLLSAGRQFVEGDVQHWWHPPSGRGVRTHISDDYLWLPQALCRYVQATHDTGVLAVEVAYLEGRVVPEHDDSYFDLPQRSGQTASVYQHAVRALMHGMRYGAHGLPLMGTGDWNDGMNEVGHQGQGESVWLGFFFCDVLQNFAGLARLHGDTSTATRCDDERKQLAQRLEDHGWDGQWYRRAYFDDGTPLGSKDNVECQIDSIAQSWAVLSGVGQAQRVQEAMNAVAERLVRPEAGLVQLLDPPFNRLGPNPGYIAGYVPGVRENGGQYTHSAVWATMAFAALGDAKRAWTLMDMINPVRHGRTAAQVETYKVEPYVVAADVYSVPPHTGRGGWSWYTGSAGWMYRLIIESLLGINLEIDAHGARLVLRPCMPAHWPSFSVDYRFHHTLYKLVIEPGDTPQVRVDGVLSQGDRVTLVNDGATHTVHVSVVPK